MQLGAALEAKVLCCGSLRMVTTVWWMYTVVLFFVGDGHVGVCACAFILAA